MSYETGHGRQYEEILYHFLFVTIAGYLRRAAGCDYETSQIAVKVLFHAVYNAPCFIGGEYARVQNLIRYCDSTQYPDRPHYHEQSMLTSALQALEYLPRDIQVLRGPLMTAARKARVNSTEFMAWVDERWGHAIEKARHYVR